MSFRKEINLRATGRGMPKIVRCNHSFSQFTKFVKMKNLQQKKSVKKFSAAQLTVQQQKAVKGGAAKIIILDTLMD